MLRFGAVSWDYRATPEEFQNRLQFSPQQWNEIAENFNSSSHVLLVTCNRVEFYFTFDDSRLGEGQVRSLYPGVMLSQDAVTHLFRVASGLESMSVGENEILAQVKAAYEKSRSDGEADKLISLIFRKAISVGKMVREKTRISRGKTSIPVIAVDMASGTVDLHTARVCIVGTGQMSETFLKYLVKKEPGKITVVGRSPDKAASLADAYGCHSAPMSELPDAINSSEVIFTATSSRNILVWKDMVRREHWPKTFVDISNPRNIDPEISSMPGVRVIDLRDIQAVSTRNSSMKKEEIPKAESLVGTELENFRLKMREFQAEELLTKSYTFAESVAMMEIGRMMKEIGKGMDPNEATRKSASAMATRILGNYTAALKEAAANGDFALLEKLQAIFR